MIRHIVLLRFKPGMAEDDVRALREALARLPARIPEVRRYQFGADAGLVDGNADFAIVADFEDAEAWRRYVDHPEHKTLIAERIAPLLAERVAVQVEVG